MAISESIETPQLIARECRQLVLSQGLAGAVATIGVATLFLLVVRDVHPFEYLFGWSVAVATISVLRILLATWAKRSRLDSGKAWPNTPAICIAVGMLSGGVWGAAATVLFPLGHSELYFITAFLLIGMPAGAISSFGAWWPAYGAYVLSSVGPFALYFFVDERAEFNVAGVAACLFGTFLLREGFVISRTIQRNIAQRIALMTMTRSLGDAVDRADAANRAKSTFLANMSHELRTPLNAIIGMSQLLAEAPDAPQHRQLPNSIHRAGQSLLALISDVLDLSQIEAGKISLHPAPISPHQVIEDVLDMFCAEAASKSLRLDATCSDAVPQRFVGDPARLRQILVNLVSNAIKFTDEGGVRIEVDMETDAAMRHVLRIEVVDTGSGIPEDQQGLIFSAFHQADASSTRAHFGTGLGLKISRDLVVLMGGSISVSSVLGAGSRFLVKVPEATASIRVADADAAIAVERSETPVTVTSSIAGLRVLVVEDNQLNASLVKLMLERDGCHVDCAGSGATALDLLHAQPWHVVLMDCQMPSMDGYATTRRWREIEVAEQRPRLPILALTAHAMADDRKKCLDAGMDDYLTKPVKLEDLRDAVSRLVMVDAGPTDLPLP
jgi:signal transduction histidine kinase/CheY-like chemotaxis protein